MNALEAIKLELSAVEAVILIVDDPLAQKVLVGWSLYRPPPFPDAPLKKNETSESALRRLWEAVGAIDFTRLALLSGVPASKAERSFERLRAANLLWPDGTVMSNALTIIRGRSNAILRSFSTYPLQANGAKMSALKAKR